MSICAAPDCTYAALFAGRCSLHAATADEATCAYKGCTDLATTRDWCQRHYQRLMRARAIPMVRYVAGNCHCGKPAKRRWEDEPMCRAHYQAAWKASKTTVGAR